MSARSALRWRGSRCLPSPPRPHRTPLCSQRRAEESSPHRRRVGAASTRTHNTALSARLFPVLHDTRLPHADAALCDRLCVPRTGAGEGSSESQSQSQSQSMRPPRRRRPRPLPLDPASKAAHMKKHNAAERRRRQRIDELLLELSAIVGCKRRQKGAILRATLDKVKGMERRIAQLEANAQRSAAPEPPAFPVDPGNALLLSDPAGAGADTPLPILPLRSSTPSATSVSSVWSHVAPSEGWVTPGFDAPSLDGDSLMSLHGQGWLCEAQSSCKPLPPATALQDSLGLGTEMSISRQSSPAPFLWLPNPCPHGSRLVSLQSAHRPSSAERSRSVPEYVALVNAAAVPIVVIDLDGDVLICNQSFASFLGYRTDELLYPGSTFLRFMHPDSVDQSLALLLQLMRDNTRIHRVLHKYVCQNGIVRRALVTCWMMYNRGGEPIVVRMIEPVPCPPPTSSHALEPLGPPPPPPPPPPPHSTPTVPSLNPSLTGKERPLFPGRELG